MNYDRCPKCGGSDIDVEKDSSSGRVMREYTCRTCRWSDYEDEGTALWQALSDAREAEEARKPAATKPSIWTALWRRLFPRA
jgi:hypothetical protein